jgi:hypothetical protein
MKGSMKKHHTRRGLLCIAPSSTKSMHGCETTASKHPAKKGPALHRTFKRQGCEAPTSKHPAKKGPVWHRTFELQAPKACTVMKQQPPNILQRRSCFKRAPATCCMNWTLQCTMQCRPSLLE